MKRRLQPPRSGQHSGIGQRTTRGRGPGSSSTFSTTTSSKILITPASAAPISSPRPIYKKQASAPPSRRASSSSNSQAPAKKKITPRSYSSFPSSRPSCCPSWHQQEEEILAEIIVSTEDLDSLDTMDSGQSDFVEAPTTLVG